MYEHSPHDALGRMQKMRAIACRFAAALTLIGIFYALDWTIVRVALRNTLCRCLEASGYAPERFSYGGSPAIRVGTFAYHYTADCTYLDLLLVIAPFLWIRDASLVRNVRRILLAALLILGGNVFRNYAVICFTVRGIDWRCAHDIPDYAIWWPTVVIVGWFSLRRDLYGPGSSRCRPPG
jgi:hypothetical protein